MSSMLFPSAMTARPTSTMQQTTALVWFRNDLRLADHQPLHYALQAKPTHLLPFFAIDRSQLLARPLPGITTQGPPQLGPHRCRYVAVVCTCLSAYSPRWCLTHMPNPRALLQALHALQHDLHTRSSALLHEIPGNTPAFVANLVHSVPPCQRILLVHHQQWGSAALERAVANSFIAAAKSRGCACAYGGMHSAHVHVRNCETVPICPPPPPCMSATTLACPPPPAGFVTSTSRAVGAPPCTTQTTYLTLHGHHYR